MAKYLRNGRSKPTVIVLQQSMLTSAAWLYLSPHACKILIELRRRFNGKNNGDISFSCREAAELAGCSKSSAKRHFDALIKHGFIDMHNKGVMRNRHATTWFLTFEASEHSKAYPTNRWRDFEKTSVLQQNNTVPTIEL